MWKGEIATAHENPERMRSSIKNVFIYTFGAIKSPRQGERGIGTGEP